ncbi:glycosyltransferase family 2 protein [Methylobacterium sp. E-005]|uniref:glycosyltransferase family 2 protein n=1 Tax=Methylobacterium sp. E-005 TaxID=2836549 RepID=UPI001FB9C5BC|nr:glycosyltransferase family 2 protein [Methylobacterium sp. E-005]MCJ2087045.1 glycosyltransferase family 2 protein [Methylobacterium sp. E-005]
MLNRLHPASATSRKVAETLRGTCNVHSLYAATKAHIRRLFKSREVDAINLKLDGLRSANYVVIMVVRNEMRRLEHLIKYHQQIGFEHFIVVDNASTDETVERLAKFQAVSLFKATGSYKNSRFGIDWINYLSSKYCVGKWVLHIDADEYFVYPGADTMGIDTLVSDLKSQNRASMQCLMVDMYSENSTEDNVVLDGENPLDVCPFFDRNGYYYEYEPTTNTTWIKGGVRSRIFFSDTKDGPALNKTPLVFWKSHYAFLKSSHQLWPYHLNGYPEENVWRPGGALLHFKFLSDFDFKVAEEIGRKQHTQEYTSYNVARKVKRETKYFDPDVSIPFKNWNSLSKLSAFNRSKLL